MYKTKRSYFGICCGDAVVEEAIYLPSICKSVTLVHLRDTFRAQQTRLDLLKSLPNVTIRRNRVFKGIAMFNQF